jgi:hypothetical protein
MGHGLVRLALSWWGMDALNPGIVDMDDQEGDDDDNDVCC